MRTNRWWEVWTVHTLSLQTPHVAVPQQFPSPPKVPLFRGHTLIKSLNLPSSPLPPPHISPCHFSIPLLAPFRPLPPTPASPAASVVGRGRVPPTHTRQDCWPWWSDLAAAVINASTRQEASTSTCQTNIYLLKHIISVWGHTLWWTNPNPGPHFTILLALIFPQPILHSPGKEPMFDFWQKKKKNVCPPCKHILPECYYACTAVCYLTISLGLDFLLTARVITRERQTNTTFSLAW